MYFRRLLPAAEAGKRIFGYSMVPGNLRSGGNELRRINPTLAMSKYYQKPLDSLKIGIWDGPAKIYKLEKQKERAAAGLNVKPKKGEGKQKQRREKEAKRLEAKAAKEKGKGKEEDIDDMDDL